MTAIGFVGLGAMGSRMAGRLLPGNQVSGTNRSPDKAAGLIARGLVWRDTPREVAEASEVIFSMIADDAALGAITGGPDGILAGLKPGQVYADMSTVSPRASRALAQSVRARGASLLGQTVTHIGANGQALVLKLAINLSIGAQMQAFSEGVLLAERSGIDPKLATEVMAGSAIGSPMLRARAPFVLDLPDQAWFDVRLMRKDLGLTLDAARELGVPVPSAALADAELARAEELGYGRQDIAVLFRALAEAAGWPGPGAAAGDAG